MVIFLFICSSNKILKISQMKMFSFFRKSIFFLSLFLVGFANGQKKNVLIFSYAAGFVHSSIPQGKDLFKNLAEKNGFSYTLSEDPTVFNDDFLSKIDIIVFNQTTGDILDKNQESNKPFWEYPAGAPTSTKKIQERSPRTNGEMTERNYNLFLSEKENPIEEKKPFHWVRPDIFGGKSILWGRVSLRWSEMDFEANAKEGIAIDWPVRYNEIAPWYSYVEKFIGVSGTKENLPQLPDGEFQKPFDFNPLVKNLSDKLRKGTDEKCHLIHSRLANMTEDKENRSACQNRDMCINGCPFGGYFSTQSSTLPAAMDTGNLTIRPFSLVKEIIYDKNSKKATGVRVIDTQTLEEIVFTSKIVFLCASTVASTQILQNSALDVWQEGLGSSSGELGHNLMDHNLGITTTGRIEGYEDVKSIGFTPAQVYVPRFQNLHGKEKDYLRGFGYQGKYFRTTFASAFGTKAAAMVINKEVSPLKVLSKMDESFFPIGDKYPEQFKKLHHWQIGLSAFGEILPYHENKITLNRAKKDKYGMPLIYHRLGILATGRIEGFEDVKTIGFTPSMLYLPRYQNLKGKEKDYIRGFGFQGRTFRTTFATGFATKAAAMVTNKEASALSVLSKMDDSFFPIGDKYPEQFKKLHHWQIGLMAFGEILPYYENKITLNRTEKDKYGMPLIQIDAELKENELKMGKDMTEEGRIIMDKIGAKDAFVNDTGYTFGDGVHEMGTARMGHDPKTSVLNKHNQVWDCKNVFVTDGSFMVSAGCQNPSLTYMAFTARAANYAVEELKKGNL
ncbi:MAG: hypothetical protein C4K58_04665 [Flavobacteriaceae bacterium]|nr:MAG: hypothetical protein C4K58_04665 [Flavobacteriaceae bacterium]